MLVSKNFRDNPLFIHGFIEGLKKSKAHLIVAISEDKEKQACGEVITYPTLQSASDGIDAEIKIAKSNLKKIEKQ